jgi:putative tricarboxylic transport membrane protein
MDALTMLIQGFATAITPTNLLMSALGVFIGTAIGVLPGIGPATTIALLLPVALSFDPTSAFIMFAGIYYGAQYGGSTTAVLLNIGEPSTMMTALEGNAMARAGRAGQALATAAIGSFVAGTIGTLGLTFLAPVMVDLALTLTAPDYFSLVVLAIVATTAVLGNNLSKGFMSLFVGLSIGMIGLDPQTGEARLTFGVTNLLDGIEVVIVAVGMSALAESLLTASTARNVTVRVHELTGSLRMSRDDWRRSWKPWLRGTAIGFPIGSLPAGGAELPTILSYTLEKRLSKVPEEFGRGSIEGVAGPEAANNASAAGAMSPLLAFGLPTSLTAAVMLAGFQQFGIQPGPLLFSQNPDLVWGLIASLYIGNTMLLFLNLPLIGLWVYMLKVPRPWLYAGIVSFACMGAYGIGNNPFDFLMLLVIGLLGFTMRVVGVPVLPLILGVIMGPMLEQYLRRSLAISRGDWSVFVTHPVSCVLLVVSLLLVATPVGLRWFKRATQHKQLGMPPANAG